MNKETLLSYLDQEILWHTGHKDDATLGLTDDFKEGFIRGLEQVKNFIQRS